MTHKEFYIWLDGFMTNRSWTVIQQVDIETIQDKMKEVKDDLPSLGGKTRPDWMVPIPVNPLPNNTDPYKPPYEVYCGTKEQLND